MADAMMMFLGEAHGVNWYWAQPGEFENPGVYYWDGAKNVLCVPHLSAPEAPAQADRQRVPSRAEIREVFLVNGFTVKDGQTDLKPYVYAAAHALLNLAAAPEAPAQASAVDERDRKDAERYRFIRANGRYVVKVSGESLHCGGHLPFNADKFGPAIDKAIDEARAALAQKGGAA